MLEKLNEMLEMQKALDRAILSEFSDVKFDMNRWKTAILDELGELTHELKGRWCWWKKTQKPVDDKKVLEELVDVWHFVLSFYYNQYRGRKYDSSYERIIREKDVTYTELIATLLCVPSLEIMVVLTEHLGFTVDQVYDAYIEKNQENYKRLERGY